MATAGVAQTRRRRPQRVRTAVGVLTALGLLTGCASGAPLDVAPGAGGDVPTVTGDEASATPEPESTATASIPEGEQESAVGGLVPGFPDDLIPVPDDAVILVTSAVPVGTSDVREVSLNVRTSLSTAALSRLYRESLTASGFDEVDPAESASSLAAQLTFVRSAGDEIVSVGVLDVDGGRTVSIGGRVRDVA